MLKLASEAFTAACGAPRERKTATIEGFEPDSDTAVGRAIAWLEGTAPEAEEGAGGDDTTYQVACRVKDFGISAETCLELMAEHWNDQKAIPPWSIEELELKIENAYSYGKDPIGVASPEAQFKPVALEGGATGAQEKAPARAAGLPLWTFDPATPMAKKRWIIKGVMAKGDTSGWIGPPGTGKSALILDCFMHSATNRNWRGHACKEQTAAVYFAFERAELTQRRIIAYAQRWGLTAVPVAVARKMLNLLDIKSIALVWDTIKAAEDQFGMTVGAITFDTFPKGIAAAGGDENSARDVNKAASNLRRLHETVDVHIALVGHTGKDESRGARGSNANQGDWDVDLRVAKAGGGVKKVTIEKANDQEEGPLTRFRMLQVQLGTVEGEAVMTSVVHPDIPKDSGVMIIPPNPEQQGWLDAVNAVEDRKAFSDKELAAVWNMSPKQASRRRAELTQIGAMELAGQTDTGGRPITRYCIAWDNLE